jgi:Flp pilus assembly protein TadD
MREIHPEHFLPHLRMGLILVQKGSHQRAIAELTTAVALANGSTETVAALAAAFAAAGSNEQAKKLLSQLERSRPQQYVLPYNIAKIYAAARNKSKAFDWLDEAYDEGNPDLIELNSEPIFDGIRRDPRFLDLERRVGWNV